MAGTNDTMTENVAVVSRSSSPVLVAVIGPPGAGKSTIVAALAEQDKVTVFRLRETIRAYPELLVGLAPSTDPLGWVSLEAVRRVLHAAFVEGRFALGAAAVLLDNYPGTADQLDLLTETAASVGASVAIIEVRADLTILIERVAKRRVCFGCGPDSHAPAIPCAGTERCSACGETLSRRESDTPGLHRLRLARYNSNLPEITKVAAERGIPHLCMNAVGAHADICSSARHALNQLIPVSANPLGNSP